MPFPFHTAGSLCLSHGTQGPASAFLCVPGPRRASSRQPVASPWALPPLRSSTVSRWAGEDQAPLDTLLPAWGLPALTYKASLHPPLPLPRPGKLFPRSPLLMRQQSRGEGSWAASGKKGWVRRQAPAVPRPSPRPMPQRRADVRYRRHSLSTDRGAP